MTDNTPEKVALDLLWLIADTEGKVMFADDETHRRTLAADRTWSPYLTAAQRPSEAVKDADNVFGAEDLTGDFTVSDTGTLSFPLIGDVKAVGLTPERLSKALHDRLADGFMRDPKVSVQVNMYRPFYIFGEVTRPGEYPYSAGMSVLNAVALGGGYSYRANQNYVVVRRDNRDYSANGLSHILAGDIIRVPERYF